MKTVDGVSPSVSATEIWISLDRVRAALPRARRDRAGADAALCPARAARRGSQAARRPSRPSPTDHVARNALVHRRRRSSGPGSSSWRASTSASACCTPIVGRDERERRTALNAIGPVLGRQRGVADRRRRGDVRGVPGLVRDAVLRPVPGAAAGAGGADRARRGVRVPREGRRRRAGGGRGRGRRRWAAARSRCCSGIGLGGMVAGLPIDADGEYTGSVADIFTAYGVWTGLTLLSLSRPARRDVPGAQDRRPGPRALARARRAARAWRRSSRSPGSPCGR